MASSRIAASHVLLIAALLIASCAASPGCKKKKQQQEAPEETSPWEYVPDATAAAAPPWLWEETGDLEALRTRGALRVLMPRQGEKGYLPRKGFPLDFERDAVLELAREIELPVHWVYVDERDQLMPWLLAGKGDLVAANLTVTDARKETVAFTVPIAHVREQVVTRADDPHPPKGPKDLSGRTIAVRRASSFWETVEALRKKNPKIKLVPVPETMDTEDVLAAVADGTYDLTVADSNLVEAVRTFRRDLKVAFDVTGERPIAWGVRPEAKKLQEAVNRYLNNAQLARRQPPIYKEDFDGIRKRRVLRVLTRNSAATYFLWKGQLLGFEYELAREFAKRHGLRLEVIVAPSRADLLPWLAEGRADLIAAGLTRTAEREGEFAFSRPTNKVSEIVVARADPSKPPPSDVKDLAGRTVHVRRSSSYWGTLEKLRKEGGVEFTLAEAPEELETEEIIGKVAAGEYDLTVADGHILDIERTWRDDIVAGIALGDPQPHGWVVRKDDRKLLAAIDAFFEKEYRGLIYNMTYAKYFKNERKIRKHAEFRADRTGELSPYDELARKYAEKYGYDWRLIVAQMYQESRFDPAARSWVGAIGLMQVMPRTAKEMGFADPSKPEAGIHAGVKYMDWVRDRFERELPVKDRTWFALAAYNAGYGHVADARRLAARKGWDANRWFDHVERAMLLLARPEYARKARYGYCRGEEPVKYVRGIRARYRAYTRVAPLEPPEPAVAAGEAAAPED